MRYRANDADRQILFTIYRYRLYTILEHQYTLLIPFNEGHRRAHGYCYFKKDLSKFLISLVEQKVLVTMKHIGYILCKKRPDKIKLNTYLQNMIMNYKFDYFTQIIICMIIKKNLSKNKYI